MENTSIEDHPDNTHPKLYLSAAAANSHLKHKTPYGKVRTTRCGFRSAICRPDRCSHENLFPKEESAVFDKRPGIDRFSMRP